jgi:hypothetical protein
MLMTKSSKLEEAGVLVDPVSNSHCSRQTSMLATWCEIWRPRAMGWKRVGEEWTNTDIC